MEVASYFKDIIRLTPNVAVTGSATQSSTAPVNTDLPGSPFVASYAIDGIFDTSFSQAGGGCSSTDITTTAWWQVDLLKVYEITKVAITGRLEYRK